MTNRLGKISEIGKKFLTYVGKHNKPIYPVIAVAVANGIFKPISSLTDKKEKPEVRKYAALREFLTELVAVPTYWLCGIGAAKVGEKLFKNNPDKKVVAKSNMMFIGVCTAAVFVIPAVCSIVMKALDNVNNKSKKSSSRLDISSNAPEQKEYKFNNINTRFGFAYRPKMSAFINNGGLKV